MSNTKQHFFSKPAKDSHLFRGNGQAIPPTILFGAHVPLKGKLHQSYGYVLKKRLTEFDATV